MFPIVPVVEPGKTTTLSFPLIGVSADKFALLVIEGKGTTVGQDEENSITYTDVKVGRTSVTES